MDEDAPDERTGHEESDRGDDGDQGTETASRSPISETATTPVEEDGPDAGDAERTATSDGRDRPETGETPPSDGDELDDRDGASSASRPSTDDASNAIGSAGNRDGGNDTGPSSTDDVPADVRKYDRFQKIEGGTYDRANEFLRDRTYITAREWAISRLCADFRTETGVEMTKIGQNLPELVPFMTDTYSPQAVNQARASFEEKVRMAGATFLYGALSDFFTADELDEVMYEATEVAKFLLEVEGVELSVEEELEAEDRISEVMREVREHSVALRHDEVECPDCGHSFRVDGDE